MTDQGTAETVPVIEEELRVEKRSVVTGRVRVRQVTDEIEQVARATLDEENFAVTRVPIGQEITSRPALRTEGDVIIVPVVEEILVVEKRLVLKEELHLRRVTTQETVEVPVTLRKQRAVIERVGAGPDPRADEED